MSAAVTPPSPTRGGKLLSSAFVTISSDTRRSAVSGGPTSRSKFPAVNVRTDPGARPTLSPRSE